MRGDQARRLKKKENGRLKRLVANLPLDKCDAQEGDHGKRKYRGRTLGIGLSMRD